MLIRAALLIENPELRRRFERLLHDRGVFVSVVRRKEFGPRSAREGYDLVVATETAHDEGIEGVMRHANALAVPPRVIFLTSGDDPVRTAGCIEAGAVAALHVGLTDELLAGPLDTLLEHLRVSSRQRWVEAREHGGARLADFISDSPVMAEFVRLVERVRSADSSLLLLGETGVGKEHLAQAIHAESHRSGGPFVAINCGALPESLLEAELFGHEKGAFTGAHRTRRGQFELAHGGTLFLDEIGEMPIHLQTKLLRALQDRQIQPVGAERTVPVDVRVITATNRDLEAEAQAKTFRSDLYFRLAVVTLTIPPLRERREDIPRLARFYLERFTSRFGRELDGIRADALDALVNYSWPGNVRELANVIERAVLLCNDDEITPNALPDGITGTVRVQLVEPSGAEPHEGLPERFFDLPWKEVRAEVVDALERDYLHGLLSRHRGRVGGVAECAGMDPRSLFDKMKRHGLRKEDYRA